MTNKTEQQLLDCITLKKARQYITEGHFAAGSMLPKVGSVVKFLERGGPQAIITNPPNILNAVQGSTGTRFIPS